MSRRARRRACRLRPTGRRFSTGWPARSRGRSEPRGARPPRPPATGRSRCGDGGPRARLRRHLPAGHRPPERAGRAGGARARRGEPATVGEVLDAYAAASRRWVRSPAPATPRSTTAAGTRPRSAAASARRSRRPRCSARDRGDRRRARRGAGRRAARRVRLGRQVAAGRARGRVGRRRRAARGGGRGVPLDRVAAAWPSAYGGDWAEPGGGSRPSSHNWIKAWPCCLQTHGAIEAPSASAGCPRAISVLAHPVSRQAAGYDAVETPLQAKFSIPYTTAYTLLNGAPACRRLRRARRRGAAAGVADRGPHRPRARRVGVRAARRRRRACAGRGGAGVAAASSRRGGAAREGPRPGRGAARRDPRRVFDDEAQPAADLLAALG